MLQTLVKYLNFYPQTGTNSRVEATILYDYSVVVITAVMEVLSKYKTYTFVTFRVLGMLGER